jgi:hypothetical protein
MVYALGTVNEKEKTGRHPLKVVSPVRNSIKKRPILNKSACRSGNTIATDIQY